jgi:hypothetical protein
MNEVVILPGVMLLFAEAEAGSGLAADATRIVDSAMELTLPLLKALGVERDRERSAERGIGCGNIQRC